MVLSFVQPCNRLLRQAFKIKTLLSSPIRNTLRWAKFMSKSSAKLARKSSAHSRVLSKAVLTRSRTQVVAKLPPLIRRKRVVMRGLTSMIKSRARIHVAAAVKPADPWRTLNEPCSTTPIVPPKPPQHVRTTHTLTVSVADVYKATCRMVAQLPREDASDEDRAILEKLRSASFKHELIAGVKVEEERIKNIEADRRGMAESNARAAVLRAEHRRRVEEGVARAKWEAQQSKRVWAKYVKAALRGQKARMNPTLQDVSRWEWYEAFWNAFETGGVKGVVPFESLPWPTLKPSQMDLENYESFILRPARPHFEKLNWYERVQIDRKHWNVENVRQKVIPFVAPEIHSRVIRCAGILCGYLDQLIDKYTTCDY
ncbi:hypothetical protein AAF712_010637 [Marasmius tenuissimus]|uniref:Uncharacterized protein n=1 Tax=Marasmius tenuissimus TaxID=585030 RepID=A0ABR2ZND3_9AGAR|nr:hypothetical protein PM082_000077 [Marasmius tenuissimus]